MMMMMPMTGKARRSGVVQNEERQRESVRGPNRWPSVAGPLSRPPPITHAQAGSPNGACIGSVRYLLPHVDPWYYGSRLNETLPIPPLVLFPLTLAWYSILFPANLPTSPALNSSFSPLPSWNWNHRFSLLLSFFSSDDFPPFSVPYRLPRYRASSPGFSFRCVAISPFTSCSCGLETACVAVTASSESPSLQRAVEACRRIVSGKLVPPTHLSLTRFRRRREKKETRLLTVTGRFSSPDQPIQPLPLL